MPINSFHGQEIVKLVRFRITKLLRSWIGLLPSKHFVFFKMSSRCLEDVFSLTLFVFQDLLRTSLRRFPKTSLKRLPRRLQDVFKMCLKDVLQLCLQDVFARRLVIMSSRRLQDVLEDKKMLHWRRLQYVFTKTNVCWVVDIVFVNLYIVYNWKFNRIILDSWNTKETITLTLANVQKSLAKEESEEM